MAHVSLNSDWYCFFVYVPVLQKEWRVTVAEGITFDKLAHFFSERYPILATFCPLYFYDSNHQVYLDPSLTPAEMTLPAGTLLYLI